MNTFDGKGGLNVLAEEIEKGILCGNKTTRANFDKFHVLRLSRRALKLSRFPPHCVAEPQTAQGWEEP